MSIRGIAEFLEFFFFNDTATTEIYTLSLHDALPISAAGRQVEHVALPDQRLCALLVEDGARIHFARDLEGDARWNVGLDKPGNHVHGRTLRGEDQVHAPGTRFLR